MRLVVLGLGLATLAAGGCSHGSSRNAAGTEAATQPSTGVMVDAATGAVAGGYRGFDRNDYPGDDTMARLHKTFAFTGYWLTNPPGEEANSWQG